MANIPHSKSDVSEMLNKLNINSIDNLFDIIPNHLKFDFNKLKIGDSLSEQELCSFMDDISDKNNNSLDSLCFMGGGIYDHYIPRVIDTISSRSEFYTAYTPYQPEVSQGTLQYLYEFQTMLCNLSGMEVANASLYDCASAIAEACSLSISATKRNKILLSSMLHPSYIEVIRTYFSGKNIEFIIINEDPSGVMSIDELKKNIDDNIASIVVQSPNYYGLIEDISSISKIKQQSLLIVVSDPISMSLLKSPGELGADVYVGEGQPLGNYMSYGGPCIGLFATKLKYARKMPGRIIGRTVDIEDKEGFVMTLQTREQHIRRDRATSNICTNQGLLALRCTLYLALMGKEGVPGIAKICYDNSHYAAENIKKIKNFSIYKNNYSFIKEFVIKSPISASKIQKIALKHNILIDKPIGDTNDNLLLVAFTEKRSKKHINKLIDFLSSF